MYLVLELSECKFRKKLDMIFRDDVFLHADGTDLIDEDRLFKI